MVGDFVEVKTKLCRFRALGGSTRQMPLSYVAGDIPLAFHDIRDRWGRTVKIGRDTTYAVEFIGLIYMVDVQICRVSACHEGYAAWGANSGVYIELRKPRPPRGKAINIGSFDVGMTV